MNRTRNITNSNLNCNRSGEKKQKKKGIALSQRDLIPPTHSVKWILWMGQLEISTERIGCWKGRRPRFFNFFQIWCGRNRSSGINHLQIKSKLVFQNQLLRA